MSKLVTIVTGSVRPNSAGKKIAITTKDQVIESGLEAQIVDLAELNMPFFDSEIHPAQPNYKLDHESVQKWQSIVQESDALLFLTPEYNHQISPVQLNAIDWLHADWKDKPAGVINYGFSGAPFSGEVAQGVMSFVGMRVAESMASLSFGEGDVEMDGSSKNPEVVTEKLQTVIDEVAELIKAQSSATEHEPVAA